MRASSLRRNILLCVSVIAARSLRGQSVPIAIVPVEGVKISGALSVADGKAIIGVSGSIAAGDRTAVVMLPHRGNLHVCATTRISLTSDASIQTEETPGLMIALERGALEANFATGKNSDVILTPDFRILISGPGTSAVQVRLGEKGDTCVDNRGPNAPYVLVGSVFDGGAYRVQADQRVLFEHGSLHDVVDNEKESCGCPPDPAGVNQPNAFPEAQSAGMSPLPKSPDNKPQIAAQLPREEAKPVQPAAETPAPAAPAQPAPKPEQKPGVFTRIGRFLKKLFGG